MSDVQEIEAYLAHYGVKGMRWGVRRGRDDSSGGTARKSKPATKKGPPPRRSKAEMERLAEVRKARIKLGKDVTKSVLIAIGTVAVASMAGPVVAAGAAAVARSLPGEAFGGMERTSSGPASYGPGKDGYDFVRNRSGTGFMPNPDR